MVYRLLNELAVAAGLGLGVAGVNAPRRPGVKLPRAPCKNLGRPGVA